MANRTHYAIWKFGGKRFVCSFGSKQDRDKKTGENPDFDCIMAKDAKRVIPIGAKWHAHDSFNYCEATR